ncbi:MAG TPA: xanthine dehydrogenase family protein molybdopterin-binding subunit [Acetobacteraceae bacterium]|nr:xanthine dehydrogenase family protein molybdopterin-binding subunit [Acetobacteraceae bacterium]
MTERSSIGASPRRREDARFLTGQGAYLDDLRFPDLAHAVLLRSPHAHARIAAIDTAHARAAPGVRVVLTAADVHADGLQPLLPTVIANPHTGEPFAFLPQPLLAGDRVRHVGEAVALIVADTKAQALDAAELVAVEYDPLPSVTEAADAAAPGAPELAAEAPGNRCLAWRTGDEAAVAAAFAAAAHVVRLRVAARRIVTNPMEPRGAVGLYDPASGRYTLHVSSQSLHANRDAAARALGVPPERVRFVAPDVGGGFGAKNFPYPEHALLAWAARRVGRPVKWIASRSETFLADHQGRDHQADAALALDAEGRFLALRVESLANLGAYLAGSAGGVQTGQYAQLPGAVYAIPSVALDITAVFTNTPPIGVLRGPGFAEQNAIIERLIDAAARQCGFDRLELRRRNLVPAAAMPVTNALGCTIDSGDFPAMFDLALARADVAGFPARRAGSAACGRLRGLGVACHIKGTGGAPRENVDIRFAPDGTVALITGTQTIGQGHETTFPQILADRLGLPNAAIRLVQGDTDLTPLGGGHGSSRATYMGGTAIWRAAEAIIAKGKRIAAAALEAAEADIGFADGRFTVAGTHLAIGLPEVAARARAAGTPLDTYEAWTRKAMTFPNGAHVVEVEIDPDTGQVALVRHAAVDDYGVLVNPMVAAGQAHGAIAQGAGQALGECAVYDPGSGQPLAASFMDYSLPRAADLPDFDLGFNATRCTTNPLGVKGCGEAGTIGVFPAIVNAVLDALAPHGGAGFEAPASPFAVWRALREGGRPPLPSRTGRTT